MHLNYRLGRNNNRLARQRLLIISLCAFSLAALTGTFFIINTYRSTKTSQSLISEPTSNPVISSPVLVNPSLPLRIQIPRIDVDATIDYMGLTKAGDMESPTNIDNGGWYKNGPIPGHTGSAVIAGHLSGQKGVPGVFKELDKLEKGDKITVKDDKAQTIVFTVRETRTYDQNDRPTEVFNSTSGAHLNLITCTGGWNTSDRSFTRRLVVFSDRDE
ncbi:MAG: class F sortase [bacterium]|nr:class F sortase [bacterium]